MSFTHFLDLPAELKHLILSHTIQPTWKTAVQEHFNTNQGLLKTLDLIGATVEFSEQDFIYRPISARLHQEWSRNQVLPLLHTSNLLRAATLSLLVKTNIYPHYSYHSLAQHLRFMETLGVIGKMKDLHLVLSRKAVQEMREKSRDLDGPQAEIIVRFLREYPNLQLRLTWNGPFAKNIAWGHISFPKVCGGRLHRSDMESFTELNIFGYDIVRQKKQLWNWSQKMSGISVNNGIRAFSVINRVWLLLACV